ncbi:DUF1493 family protein [Paraburkholderia susongensis]|uniref:DUF1493 family protein n=1 Tax=Paraburkholderia susongensis TaxID=1515439 RepID=UPI000A1C9DB8|nr:DUF1493 family protein [Paraburkholderia susongensis]
MDDPEISAELVEFIRKKFLYPARLPISLNTRVEDDLGVAGDDSLVFMIAFFEKFNVMPGDFDCDRYFEGEGVFDPFSAIVRIVFRRVKEECARESLTIAMLQHAIDLGVWDSQRLRDRENQRNKE